MSLFAQKLASLNAVASNETIMIETDEHKRIRMERNRVERLQQEQVRVAAEHNRQLGEIESMPAEWKLKWETFTILVWRLVAHTLFGEKTMKVIRDAVRRNPFWFSNIDVFWYIKKTGDVLFGEMIQEVFLERMDADAPLGEFERIHFTVAALGATEAIAQIKNERKDVAGVKSERGAMKELAKYIVNNFDLPSWLNDQLLHHVEATGVFKPKPSEFMNLEGEFVFVRLWNREVWKKHLESENRRKGIERITASPASTETSEVSVFKKEKYQPKQPSAGRLAFIAAKAVRNAQKPNPQGKNFSDIRHEFSPNQKNGTNGTTHA